MKKLTWIAFSLVFMVACLDDPDCFQLHNDVIGVTFRVIGTGQADSVLLKNFNTTGTFVPVISFNYQLNYFQEQDRLNFEGVEGFNFLSFGYKVRNQFVSEDCGSAFVLSDLHIQEHDFDSARIVSATPTKTGGTNIEIYRCPKTDTLTLDFSQLYATSNGITVTRAPSDFISHPFDFITDSLKTVFSGRAATVRLPVNLNKNHTTFIFKTDVEQDTLVVGYNRVIEQRYRPCGIQTFVNELRIIEHTFDSISFALNSDDEPARTLQDPHIPNLSIFDCPETNLLQVSFKKGTASQVVTLSSITGDHFNGNLLSAPYSSNTVNLPVDLSSDNSTFYIEYQDGTIDTLRVQYTRANVSLFNACKDPVIINVREITDLPDNINVIPTKTTLRFPPEPNVEITVD